MRILAIGLAAALAAGTGWGQAGGGAAGGAGTAGGFGRIGRGGSSMPGNTSVNQRPLFLSGKVALSDGSNLPEPVKIERICGASARLESYTDLKGRFSFEVGRSQDLPDASEDASNGNFGVPNRARDRSPFACDLRVSLPGFRSETISLSESRYMDSPDMGTIVLRRIANVEGLTISATSALAPKDAKKAFDKGMEAVNKKNAAEAQKDFEKAAELYPRFAAAWYELGLLNEGQNRFDDARKSYAQSVTADAKFIPPHERLAWIALRESKWQELADDSDTILKLDPIDYPDAYYLGGVAHLQLGNWDVAEKDAREAIARDTAHKNPRAPYVLALALAQKHDFDAAAPLLRTFLEQNPNASDAGTIRQQLAAIEEAARQKAASAQAKQ
jgi:tetratricopeptide (TPR) repeat protein